MAKKANVQARIDHWKQKEGHTHSRILHEGLTYDQATRKEREEGEAKSCTYKSGGECDSDHDWSVYHVWGGSTG